MKTKSKTTVIKFNDLMEALNLKGFYMPSDIIKVLQGDIPADIIEGDTFRLCKKALNDGTLYFRHDLRSWKPEDANDVNNIGRRYAKGTFADPPENSVIIECMRGGDVPRKPKEILTILIYLCSYIDCCDTKAIEFNEKLQHGWEITGDFETHSLCSLYSWYVQEVFTIPQNRAAILGYIKGNFSDWRGRLKGHINSREKLQILLEDLKRTVDSL